eukprot:CAMPEP_0168481590 /NCGR_PEP_ID=MMETSP0228-20121227/64592_1 /TAXON_ID=133427 /ORGANISM="Protoceratium reticulatum, Strain CCCM 535 (=CCMP 1889)" /LENGTH=55 /DNA_ID=CAMNT_0008497967 /DNA_START=32 /DNA_END=196 /DNA_ORIENTATION=-
MSSSRDGMSSSRDGITCPFTWGYFCPQSETTTFLHALLTASHRATTSGSGRSSGR